MLTTSLRTQLPLPPRIVHAIPTKRSTVSLWFLIIGLVIVAIAGFLYALNVSTWALDGRTIPASLTAGRISTDKDNNTTHTLTVRYALAGHPRTLDLATDKATYDRLIVNDHPRRPTLIAVRYHRLGPLEYADAPGYADPLWMTIGAGWSFVLLPLSLLALLAMGTWGRPALARRLCVSGTPTPGVVTRKREFRSRSPSVYNVDFTYTDPRGRTRKARTFPPNAAQYDAVEVNGPVTVLIDPLHPDRAVAYECCAFTIEGATPAEAAPDPPSPAPVHPMTPPDSDTDSAPPTQLPPPPRRVITPIPAAIRLIRIGGVISCIMMAMVFALSLLTNVAPWLSHTEVPAHITGGDITHGDSTDYHLHCAYTLAGRPHEDDVSVSQSVYNRLIANRPAGSPPLQVRARVFQLGRATYTVLPDEQSPTPGLRLEGVFLVSLLVWIGMLAWAGWLVPARPRRLLSTGNTARGVLISRREESNRKGARYAAEVTYHDADGIPYTATVYAANRDLFRKAAVGQPVTVLYDPRRPNRPLVYELTTLKVAPA